MTQLQKDEEQTELPLSALILQCKKDRYKLAYSAIRWAKEIKQKENLPESIPALVPRAMREILEGKVPIKDIEKLPVMVKIPAQPAPGQTPGVPTIKVNVASEDGEEKKGKE